MRGLGRLLLERLAVAAAVLFVVVTVVFFLLPTAGGDAAQARLGTNATPDQVRALHAELGLDRPVLQRYWSWLTDAVTGDFGASYVTDMPVGALISERLGSTVVLVVLALVVLLPLTMTAGTYAGLHRGGRVDRVVSTATLITGAAPEFVVGAGLALLFAVQLGWLPAVSSIGAGESVLSDPSRLVLPTVTLVVGGFGHLTRLVRAGVADAAGSDAVEMARLNSVPEARIVRRWILPVAMRPVVPAVARGVIYLIGGTLIVETVFGFPGLSALLVGAVGSQDMPVVLAITAILATVAVVLNLLADLAATLSSPAMRAMR